MNAPRVFRFFVGLCAGLVLTSLPATSGLSPVKAAGWSPVSGTGRDIGAGGGQVWVIGTNRVHGGYGIYQRAGSGWTARPGGGAAIDVDAAGGPWVVNDTQQIYQWTGSVWARRPGSGRDVGAGGGQVWVIGTNRVHGGYGIYQWTGSGWAARPGGGERISVESRPTPWVVNSTGRIYWWQ
jgi:hypothetical protein